MRHAQADSLITRRAHSLNQLSPASFLCTRGHGDNGNGSHWGSGKASPGSNGCHHLLPQSTKRPWECRELDVHPRKKGPKSWGTTVQYRLQKTAPATSCCHWTNDSLCFTGKEDKKSTCLSHIPLRHVWKPLTIKYGHAYWSLIGSPKICGPQIPFPMLKEWIEMTKPTICCIRLETSISSICKCLGSLCLQNWFVIRL